MKVREAMTRLVDSIRAGAAAESEVVKSAEEATHIAPPAERR